MDNKLLYENGSDYIIYFIPSNPGIIDFYELFFDHLYEICENNISIHAYGHLGHSKNYLDKNVYDLLDQIKYHNSNLKKLYKNNKNKKFILIGHSLGAYILSHICLSIPKKAVYKKILLFPAIENLGKSLYGRFINWFIYPLRYFFLLCIYILSFLPDFFVRIILMFFFGNISFHRATKKIIDPNVFINCMCVFRDEVEYIKDTNVLEDDDKNVFYLNSKDGWCPSNNYHNKILRDFEEAKIIVTDIDNCFILDNYKKVCQDIKNIIFQ